MNETMRQLWGEMLRDYPGISGWFLEAVKSGMIAGCVLLIVWLLASRSALSRSWVVRMGFLALGIATVWNFVPRSAKTSQPRIIVEVSAPLPSTSLRSVPFAEIPVSPIPNAEIEYGDEQPKSPDAIVEAAQQVGLEVEKSPFSLKSWIEGNLKLIWFGMASIIALWLTLRYLAGVFWLRRNGRPVGDQMRQLAEESTASLRARRVVQCRLVEGLSSPLITGWWQANIWLPDHVVEMPPAHQRVIIEHELAHFRRNDFPWQAYASLIAAFWWWNPLVFLLLRKLKSEAELAADAVVVSGTSSDTDYAEALIKVAAGASYVSHREVGVPMLGRSSIEKRVKEIVAENPFRNRIGWIASMMIGLVAAGGGLLASFTAVAQQREEAVTEAGAENSSDADVQKQLAGEDANTLVCVVAAEDGTLVEGAEVYFELLQVPNGESAVPLKLVGKTDASGESKIQVDRKIGRPENLKYSIFVRHPAFGIAAIGGINPNWNDPRTLLLSKGFPLKFRVLDGKGDPVGNLGLRVARARLPDGEIELMKFWGDVPELPDGFWRATTDSDGRCVINGLPAGRFYVDHDNPDFAQFPGRLLYPKFQHVAGVDLNEIELKAEPAATISGTVRYPDGKPVEGAGVKVLEHYHHTQGGCSDETTTDSEGRYLLKRLLPSDYDVRVTVGGKIRDSWTAKLKPIELALGEQKQDFDFKLEEGGLVTGRVTLEDTGTPVPGYRVGASTKNGPSPLHLWWAVTDEDGYYSLRIPAGKRRVYPSGLNPEGYTTQKSDRSGMGVDIDVKESGTYNNDFALLRETGIRGIVVNTAGDPVPGARVTCYDPPDRMSDPMKTESDEEGRFSFIFPAGTEEAGIFAEFEGEISKPGVKFPVASEAKVVVGETQWARVRGRVVDVSDQPIEGARVSWSSRFGIEKQSYEAMTDPEGYFESKMLPENFPDHVLGKQETVLVVVVLKPVSRKM